MNFPVQAITPECPEYMYVNVGTWGLRPCFENTYNLQYCNFGLNEEEDAYVEVTLDPFLSYVSSSIPLTSQNGDTYTFDLGAVPSGECGNFSITTFLDCEAEVGQTHCVEAHIYPDEICPGAGSNWSGASLQVEGSCDEGEVQFKISNVGNQAMLEPSPYLVVEDHVIMMMGTIPVLASGADTIISKTADGATYRIEVDQVADHAGQDQLAAWIEGCNTDGATSTGFVTQFSAFDDDPFISISCIESRAAYDPNEKRAEPKGFWR